MGGGDAEELVEEEAANASMATRFRNPSIKKGVRGLSPKALVACEG